MATVFFLSLPSHGHINPTLPVVAELVRQGEQMVYYATEAFRAKIEATGATFRPYGWGSNFDPSSDVGGPFGLMARSIEATEQLLPDLVHAIAVEQPDYLLIDSLGVWGTLVAQKLKLPTVALYSTFALNSSVMGALQRSKAPKPSPRDIVKGLPLLLRYLNTGWRINRQYGVRTPGPIKFFVNQQALNIVFTSREFQPAAQTFDARFAFVGPSVAARHEIVPFPWEQLDQRPLIYISLGTIFNNVADFYRTCFAAFADSPYQVVMSIGSNVDEQTLGPPPDNFIVRRYVPQLEILARAALFITHGGMNSVSEALLEGVPLLVVPQIGDQFFVAQRVTNLGAGWSLATGQLRPEQLNALAARILSDSRFKAAAQRIGQSLKAAGGYQQAAAIILAFKQRMGIER